MNILDKNKETAEDERLSVARNADALALAELIYDIYREKKEQEVRTHEVS